MTMERMYPGARTIGRATPELRAGLTDVFVSARDDTALLFLPHRP